MKEYSKLLWADSIFILLTATPPAPMTVLESLLDEFIHKDSKIMYARVIIILYTFVHVVVL